MNIHTLKTQLSGLAPLIIYIPPPLLKIFRYMKPIRFALLYILIPFYGFVTG